jgi:transposase
MGSRQRRLTRMREVIERWHASGDSARSFAKANGLAPSTLFRWQQRLTESDGAAGREKHERISLLPVRVVAGTTEPEATDAIEVVLTTGDRLHVGPGVAEDRLRVVVRVLRTAC